MTVDPSVGSELDIVVIGAGQAAAQTVGALVTAGHQGRITVIGDEPVPPYQRPPLSKAFLKGELPAERLWLRPADWYDRHGVELVTGDTAIELDPRMKTVSTSGGLVRRYDAAVIATGSRVRPLPVAGADLAGVHGLRTMGDVESLLPSLADGKRLLVVGAGFIGLEIAAVAAGMGLEVVVVETADRCLSRVVGPETAAALARVHEEHGVRFVYGRSVVGFSGEQRVESARLADGTEVPCDVVIVGIGALPNQELAELAGIECRDGILVDPDGRTSDASVFAAGDCANRPLDSGARGRLESVHNAVEQGNLVAAAIGGRPRPKTDVPWFWSDQYDRKLQIAGVSQGHDESVVRRQGNREFAVFQVKEGRVQAVEALNSPTSYMVGKRLIASCAQVRGEQLADPEFDIKQLLRAG